LFALAALDASGAVQVWHVMSIAAASSVIAGIEWPTRQALFPHLIERPGLLSAVALNSVLWQSTRMIMPALGGVLIALTSTGFLFAVSGVGFLVMFAVMFAIPLALPGVAGGTALEQIRQGLSFIAGHELFRWLIVLSYAGMFFVSAYMQLMPAFAQHLNAGEAGYGFLLSATGVGSVVGTLVIGGAQRTRALGWILLGGALLSAVALYGFALAVQLGWYPAALVMAFASSVCASVFMISSMTVMQLEVPDALRGRVMGIHSITYSLMPLGGLLLGAIAHDTTVVTAVVFGASAFLVITLVVAATRPSIRAIDGNAFATN
jgi:predicted MFS family arabinose efflux permease